MRLGVECRGFLQFLENAGILDAECREMIVERPWPSANPRKSNWENLKVIVLMVLWQQDRPINGLILDELLNESDEDDEPGLIRLALIFGLLASFPAQVSV